MISQKYVNKICKNQAYIRVKNELKHLIITGGNSNDQGLN